MISAIGNRSVVCCLLFGVRYEPRIESRKPNQQIVRVKTAIILIGIGCYALSFLVPVSYAQEGKVYKGIRFNVPEDWPIVEKGGGYTPVSVEEYILEKFKEVNARIDSLAIEKEQRSAVSSSSAYRQEGIDIEQIEKLENTAETLAKDMEGFVYTVADLTSRIKALEDEDRVSSQTDNSQDIKKALKTVVSRIDNLQQQVEMLDNYVYSLEGKIEDMEVK